MLQKSTPEDAHLSRSDTHGHETVEVELYEGDQGEFPMFDNAFGGDENLFDTLRRSLPVMFQSSTGRRLALVIALAAAGTVGVVLSQLSFAGDNRLTTTNTSTAPSTTAALSETAGGQPDLEVSLPPTSTGDDEIAANTALDGESNEGESNEGESNEEQVVSVDVGGAPDADGATTTGAPTDQQTTGSANPTTAQTDQQTTDTQDPTTAPTPGPETSTTTGSTTTTAAPQPAPAPAAVSGSTWAYYGNPFTPQGLANLKVQGDRKYSYRFEAKHSGRMSGFQNYMQTNTSRTGYAGGDGGTIRFRLFPDNGNGLPDISTVLAELTWRPGLSGGNGPSGGGQRSYTSDHPVLFADKYWDSQPNLVAGRTYHVVVDNVSGDPSSNFISINNGYSTGIVNRSSVAPQTGAWGMAASQGSGWEEYSRPHSNGLYEVTFMVYMADGAKYGNSYFSLPKPASHQIGGSDALRQLFTPKSTQTISALSVYTSGSGKLEVSLKAGSSTVGQWSVNTSGNRHNLINTGQVTLSAGTTYSLEFRSSSGTLNMITFRDGTVGNGYPFSSGGSWDDGHSQYSTNNGSSWSNTFETYADLAGVAFSTD